MTRAQALERAYRTVAVIFIILFVLSAIAARELSPVFNRCVANRYKETTQQGNIEPLPRFLVEYPIALRCTGAFIDANDKGISAIATALIAFFTFTLWGATRGHRMHDRELHRAYVSGGGPVDMITNSFILTVDNYGRTPATLIEYAIEFCDIASIPTRPLYVQGGYRRTPSGARIPPFARALPIPPPLPIPSYPIPIVYGRFWYTDIWGNRRSFGFIQDLATGKAPLVPFKPEYIESD